MSCMNKPALAYVDHRCTGVHINLIFLEPPKPIITSQFTCEDNSPVMIKWTVSSYLLSLLALFIPRVYIWLEYENEKGVVYPNMEFMLRLTTPDETISGPVSYSCQGASSDRSNCSVTLPRDVYCVSVNLTNDLGSAMNNSTFDSELKNCVLLCQCNPTTLQQGLLLWRVIFRR